MNLFKVYPLFDVELESANGVFVYDKNKTRYLDFYGGHAVISIGHAHPHYTQKLKEQVEKISFYSNSVHLKIQETLAKKLGILSNYETYNLFLINSGAEANENALKLASFYNNRKKVIAFSGAFHGRTAAAVAVTDNPKIKPPINPDEHVTFLPFNDIEALEKTFKQQGNDICAVIVESIQGVNGIYEAENIFLEKIQALCNEYDVIFIADEIQCGYGRTGKFFAHQFANVQPDIITIAKGMGNGFPVGGVLINEKIQATFGMLGTTFGGSPLACAACLAVLEIIEQENLIEHTRKMGNYLFENLKSFSSIKEIRGKGLILGLEFEYPIKDLRNNLLYKHQIFTGNSNHLNTLRLLPSLTIQQNEIDIFLDALKKEIN
jgi:acetylornithine/N-succinyldiaminopimelate aminotransferase